MLNKRISFVCLSLLLTSCMDALAPVEAQNKDTQPQGLQDQV